MPIVFSFKNFDVTEFMPSAFSFWKQLVFEGELHACWSTAYFVDVYNTGVKFYFIQQIKRCLCNC